MSYTELTPFDLLKSGSAAPHNTQPWLVRWDRVDADTSALVLDTLPATMDFWTSGSTGPSQCWRRTREQLWAEAGLLAGLMAPGRPQAVVSFAPPRHVYGMLATVLMPARLGVPVWYRPQYFGAMPPTRLRRWAVVALPWTFSILSRNMAWAGAMDRLDILHSSAMVPASAADFLAGVGTDRASIVEVFGSTETGGVATRRWAPTDPPWELFDDVDFATPRSPGDGEAPLVIRSPRVAFQPGTEPTGTRQMDDHVEVLDDRGYRFAGRRSRLVKVNGRRINLDTLEDSLRTVLDCADLTFRPVTDATSGEHLDLLVVPAAGRPLTAADVLAATSRIEARPRRVHLVDRIDRSETGKLRQIQQPLISASGADS